MPYYVRIVFLFMTMFLVACSPTDNSSNEITISDLVGLWNSSENTDVMYTRISSNGDIIEYDFDGDMSDKGLSCYQIVSGSLTHVEANRFLVTVDMYDNKSFTVELEMLDAGHALQVYFPNNKKLSAGNSASEPLGKSQIWTRMSDDSILNKEPSCTNS